MAAILQMTVLNAIAWNKVLVFLLNFNRNLFPGVPLDQNEIY